MKYNSSPNKPREEDLELWLSMSKHEIDALKTDLKYAESDIHDLRQENDYLRRELWLIRGKLAVMVEALEESPYVKPYMRNEHEL